MRKEKNDEVQSDEVREAMCLLGSANFFFFFTGADFEFHVWSCRGK